VHRSEVFVIDRWQASLEVVPAVVAADAAEALRPERDLDVAKADECGAGVKLLISHFRLLWVEVVYGAMSMGLLASSFRSRGEES
jgi:hypothetical protein